MDGERNGAKGIAIAVGWLFAQPPIWKALTSAELLNWILPPNSLWRYHQHDVEQKQQDMLW